MCCTLGYGEKDDSYLTFDELLQRDLLLFLLLLLVLLQYKAWWQGVAVHTGVARFRTHPEPAVLAILDGLQEVLAHL